jgi:hypothetical protein
MPESDHTPLSGIFLYTIINVQLKVRREATIHQRDSLSTN